MILDREMCKVVVDLEYCIGSECHNPNSYDGWNDIEGRDYRYPVNLPVKDADGNIVYQKVKQKIDKSYRLKSEDITPTALKIMKYRFGSNELYIGRGIMNVLSYLENRYGLNFNQLEEMMQNAAKESKEE